MKLTGFLLISILTVAPISHSQEEATADAAGPVFPCEQRDEFREFDFWLGEWDVHVADGTFAGKNRIEKTQAGCALIENWLGASGTPGMSINYFDIGSKKWVQVWSSAGGIQIDIRGGLTGKGMLLEGQINYVSDGKSAPFRGLWTMLPDGRIRQFFEQSNDGGETWVTWFEGFYTRTDVQQQVSEK